MNNQYTFTDFIIKCCRAKEWNLRKFLKKKLSKKGFSFIEDDYVSRRANHNDKYNAVHNLLFIRGNPKVCLVAHTDVCRDHSYSKTVPTVKPVIKDRETIFGTRKIIQDENCEVQVGGDDRLGVAINAWIALNTEYDLGLLFTTDEEIGLVSAEYCKFEELKKFEILLQVDRGNHSNQLVSNISGIELCASEVAQRLLKIAADIGLPRNEVRGLITDVAALRDNGMCSQAVNMTCGYHSSYSSNPDEYIDIVEAEETKRYVSAIIDYYKLGKHLTDINIPANEETPVNTLFLS